MNTCPDTVQLESAQQARLYLGLDIGGTWIRAGLVTDSGVVVWQQQMPTSPVQNEAHLSAVLARLVSAATSADHCVIAGAGVACAGPVDIRRGTVSPIRLPGCHAYPLLDVVRRLVQGARTYLMVDGVAAALGEYWVGRGVGSDSMLGLFLGTGVGGGLVIAGQPILGAAGNAGHIGHVTVDSSGPICLCGRRGCVAAYASSTAMLDWVRANGQPEAAPSFADLERSARQDDRVTREAFDRAGYALGAGIAAAAALCDLDLVVIGGGRVTGFDLFLKSINLVMRERLVGGSAEKLNIQRGMLNDDAGIIGAALYAARQISKISDKSVGVASKDSSPGNISGS